MRILHIVNNLTNRGNGIINVAIDLASEQKKNGHDVAIVAGGGEFIALIQKLGVQYYFLKQSRRAGNLGRAVLGMRRIIREFKPDIIHAHMRTGLVLAWIWSRIPRVPLVGHLHNVHDSESRLMKIADRVIAVSESVKKTMADGAIPVAKLRVVLNGPLESPRTPAIASLKPRTLQHPAILTVAGMNPRKGIAELLQAFELIADEFPKAHLYLVGDGPEKALFEGQAASLTSRDRIHFEGCQSDPQTYMLAADLFVLASKRESLALVLMEARQAGCAIVASDVDGVPEALEQGRAGVLVPPSDPRALAAAFRELLNDDALRHSWQLRARQGCEFFTCSRMTADVQEVYQELVPSGADFLSGPNRRPAMVESRPE
jgi:glycosyltransferase involved in cell wall biosynthesis